MAKNDIKYGYAMTEPQLPLIASSELASHFTSTRSVQSIITFCQASPVAHLKFL